MKRLSWFASLLRVLLLAGNIMGFARNPVLEQS
jgi:hypothetical protein